MQKILDQQLYDYPSIILAEAREERDKETNPIDDLVVSHNAQTKKLKYCSKCRMTKIENSKRKCPRCDAKLPTVAEIRSEAQEDIPEKIEIKFLNFKIYQTKQETSSTHIDPMSITQRSAPQEGVTVPDILFPILCQ